MVNDSAEIETCALCTEHFLFIAYDKMYLLCYATERPAFSAVRDRMLIYSISVFVCMK